jgi:tetratricopeptide (TPR) repeat protein
MGSISFALNAALTTPAWAEWPCEGGASRWPRGVVDRAILDGKIDDAAAARLEGDDLLYMILWALTPPLRTDTLNPPPSTSYRPDHARELIENAFREGRLEPSARVLTLLAEAQKAMGETDLGRETLLRAAERTRCDDLWLALVHEYEDSGDHRRAAEILARALDHKQFAPEAWHYQRLVVLWTASRDYLRAVEVFERNHLPVQDGSRGDPSTRMYLNAAAQACVEGRWVLAESLVHKAIALDASLEQSHAQSLLATIYDATGRPELARRMRELSDPTLESGRTTAR